MTTFSAKKIVADFRTSLAAKIAAGGTSGSIQNNLDDDGVTLPTGQYYFTLDSESSQKEHIKCTLTGKNMTAIYSVSRQGVETSGTVREHRIGATVTITDFAHIKMINDFAEQYGGKWEEAVADYATLVALVGSEDGEVRVTLDDSKIYVYDLDTTTWNLAGAGGGAGTVYITSKLGTQADGDDNLTFSLNSGSFPNDKYLQVYLNGVLQENGATADYTTSGGNKAVFNAVVDDTDKITLVVISVDLYNPAWNNVTGDILPDLGDTYDIGNNTTKKFKAGNFSAEVNVGGGLWVGQTSQFDGQATFVNNIPLIPTTAPTTAGQVIALDAAAKLPAVDGSQLTNIAGSSIATASNNLRYSDDGEITGGTGGGGYTVKKTFYPSISGVFRVKFDGKLLSGDNGVAKITGGTERTMTGSYVTYSEDLTFVVGSTKTLSIQTGATGQVSVRNLRLYCDPIVGYAI